MSSKFSHATVSIKPPAICNKPPPGPDYIPPPLTIQPIQGYVEYFQPDSPSEGGMVSPITLAATGPPYTWNGVAIQGHYKALLLMACDLQQTRLSFRLDWYVDDNLADTIILNNLKARTWAPFDSGQVTPYPQPFQGRIGWHLWF